MGGTLFPLPMTSYQVLPRSNSLIKYKKKTPVSPPTVGGEQCPGGIPDAGGCVGKSSWCQASLLPDQARDVIGELVDRQRVSSVLETSAECSCLNSCCLNSCCLNTCCWSALALPM